MLPVKTGHLGQVTELMDSVRVDWLLPPPCSSETTIQAYADRLFCT